MKQHFSRFATVEDVLSPEFVAINKIMDSLHVKYQLTDHKHVNIVQFPWSEGMLSVPAFYAARMWEFPFAVLAAELEKGMKVADIGCGMTAFIVYLKEQAACEVTGIDPLKRA